MASASLSWIATWFRLATGVLAYAISQTSYTVIAAMVYGRHYIQGVSANATNVDRSEQGGSETVSENSRDALSAAVVDAVGRVTDLHQLADAIVVAAKLMSEAVQGIENQLMKITSRLDEQVTHSSTPALSKQAHI